MVNAEIVTGIYVRLDNRPGTLEHLGTVLGQRHVNIDAISLETVGSTGFARIYTRMPREGLQALEHAGIPAFTSDAVQVSLPNRPGELGRAAAEVAAAGINVEGVTTTGEGKLVLRTSDNERAQQILRKL